jgi:hypothetical protein
MLFRKYKLIIVIAFITFLLGGICFIKLTPYCRVIYPSLQTSVLHNMYFVNTTDCFLYKVSTETNVKFKLSKDKIDSIGIIILKDKLYYINKITKRLCSIELNGKNMEVIDTCNIIMPFQPLFKLGTHIYYYNLENELIRIDENGILEKMASENIQFADKAFLKANNKKIENEVKI